MKVIDPKEVTIKVPPHIQKVIREIEEARNHKRTKFQCIARGCDGCLVCGEKA